MIRLDEPLEERGVVERRFEIECEGRTVPGLVWTPSGGRGPRPLVLIAHGWTADKRTPYVVALAHRLVRHHEIAAVAVDGPYHGERARNGGLGDYLAMWGLPTLTDEAVAEWRCTTEAVQGLEEVGDGPLGFWGLSMGTIFGLPFIASEPRVRAAVLGLLGVSGPTGERPRIAAEKVRCPVLFLQQWDDELFPRDEVSALFDAIGSRDKRLHAHPGGHSAVPLEELEASQEFLARHLLESATARPT